MLLLSPTTQNKPPRLHPLLLLFLLLPTITLSLFQLDESEDFFYDDVAENTDLYDEITDENWETVERILRTSPEEASTIIVQTEYGEYGTGGQILTKEMPLHALFEGQKGVAASLANKRGGDGASDKTQKNDGDDNEDEDEEEDDDDFDEEPVPIDLAIKLIKTHPDATRVRSIDHNLPLHLAAASNQPIPVLRALLDAYPDAISQTVSGPPEYADSYSEYLPLHCAADDPTASADVLRFLIERYPAATSATCSGGNVPLYLALDSVGELESLKVLVDATPREYLDVGLEDDDDDSTGYTLLHMAVQVSSKQKVSIPVLEYIHGLNPVMVKTPDKNGILPLVSSLQHLSLDVEATKYLMNLYPAAISISTNNTVENSRSAVRVALHAAFTRCCISPEVFDVILSSHPSAASIPDAHGDLPLHKATQVGVSDPGIIQALIEAHPSAVVQPDSIGDTALHHALLWHERKDVKEQVVRMLIEANPFVVSLANSDGDLPLHVTLRATNRGERMAAIGGANLEQMKAKSGYVDPRSRDTHDDAVFRMILENYISGATMVDKDGQMPLKIACFNEFVSFEVIKLLLDNCPECVKTMEKNSNYPIHFAAHGTRPDNVKVIALLLEYWPEGASHANGNGRYPLHVALRSGQKEEVINLLLDAYPNALEQKDDEGDYPLHMLMRKPKKDHLQLITKIINQYPDAASEQNEEGDIPLHIALRNKPNKAITRQLLTLFPDSCTKYKVRNEKDDEMNMSPLAYAIVRKFHHAHVRMILELCPTIARDRTQVLLLAIAENYPLDIIQEIVRQHPESVKQVDQEGNNALMWASVDREKNKKKKKKKKKGGKNDVDDDDQFNKERILEWLVMTAPETYSGKLKDHAERGLGLEQFAIDRLRKGKDYWKQRAKEEGVVYWKDYPGMREALKQRKLDPDNYDEGLVYDDYELDDDDEEHDEL